MILKVLSPEGAALETEADSVVLPASDGQLGVMRGHAPMVASLTAGTLWYRTGSEEHTFPLTGGSAAVADDCITVLSDLCPD